VPPTLIVAHIRWLVKAVSLCASVGAAWPSHYSLSTWNWICQLVNEIKHLWPRAYKTGACAIRAKDRRAPVIRRVHAHGGVRARRGRDSYLPTAAISFPCSTIQHLLVLHPVQVIITQNFGAVNIIRPQQQRLSWHPLLIKTINSSINAYLI